MNQVLIAILSAVFYSLVFYSKKYAKGESWDWYKFGGTVLAGIIVGLFMWVRGIELNDVNFESEMVMYVGLIGLFESLVKAVVRKFEEVI